MPTLQETANRNANERRRLGVTVYSPTRTIARPNGTRANAGTAGRILNNRQAGTPSWSTGSFGGGTSTLPEYTPPQQAGTGRTALDDILDSMGGPAQPPEPEQPGGWRGVLGTVANSVPGRAFFTALDVLDRPRRAVAATVAEGLDLFGLNAESRTDGDASWSDWWNQFNDPTFGFGDIVASTGNKWLDRGIGLAGDLAMDPLNYLTGSGVIAGTGARARVNLAARAFGAGIPAETAARVGRIGIQSLDNVERRAINAATSAGENLLDRGYYFKLPFIRHGVEGHGWRVPLSGRVERAIGGGTASARNVITSSRPMSTVRYWRSEEGLQDAIGKLLTGRGDISFGVASALVNYRKGAGISGSQFNGLLSMEWEALVKQHGFQKLQDMVHEAETKGGTALNVFLGWAADQLEKQGLQRPNFPNYVPHVFTEEAINWLRNTPEGRAFHNDMFKEIDFDDLTPHMMQRRLVGPGPDGKPREYRLNGIDLVIKEGTIRELNEQFAKAMPNAGFKLLEDDIANIVARYSKSMTNSVAQAGGLLYLANQAKGLVRYADDDSVLREIVDAADDLKMTTESRAVVREKLSAAKELNATLKKERDEGVTALHGATAVRLQQLVDTMDSVPAKSRKQLQKLLAKQSDLSAKREALASDPIEYTDNVEQLTAVAEEVFNEADQAYNQAVDRLAHMEAAFNIAEQQWLDASRAANEARKAGVAGVKSPPMAPVQKEYRKTVIEATQLRIDRDAAATISTRIRDATRKQQIIERNLDSDTFMALAGAQMEIGKVDVTPPIRYVDPDTGTVQWIDRGAPVDTIPEGVEIRRETEAGVQRAQLLEATDPRVSSKRSPAAIYAEHNRRRAVAIAGHEENFPTLRVYQNQIESQTGVVLKAREDLHNAASISNRKIKDAQLHLNEMREAERAIISKIDKIHGIPELGGLLKKYNAQLTEFRAPGGPKERAIRQYADSQRLMDDARQAYDEELKKLDVLKRRQDQEALKIRFDARDEADDQVLGAQMQVIRSQREAAAEATRAANATRRYDESLEAEKRIAAELKAARVAPERETQTVERKFYPQSEGLPATYEGGARKRRGRIEEVDTTQVELVERDKIDHLTRQLAAQKQTTRQARAQIAEAQAASDAAAQRVEAARANSAAALAQRESMESDDYFSKKLKEHDRRDREVNRQLNAKMKGRTSYAQTKKGQQEAALHRERAGLVGRFNESERKLRYWRDVKSSGPWQPVSVTERADGTFEVKPVWAGVVGNGEEAAIELAEKRAWFTGHYIDRTSNEIDVIAADIARAEDRLSEMTARGARQSDITKTNNKLDALKAKHERQTKRLERFRRYVYAKYDRKIIDAGYGHGIYEKQGRRIRQVGGEISPAYTAEGLEARAKLIAQVNELVGQRNELVIERERIATQLAKLGDKLDAYDDEIAKLRRERTDILGEREETVRQQQLGVVPTDEQTLYGRELRHIRKSEAYAMRTASEHEYGYKLHWEPVEPIFQPRSDVWTPQELTDLSIAYSIQRAWDDLPADLRTPEFKAQRDEAVRVIRELTSPDKLRGGVSYPNVHMQNMIDSYDDDGLTAALEQVQGDRIPFVKPTKRSKLGVALAKGSGAGDRTPAGIARRALKKFTEINAEYGEKFVARGIIPAGELSYWQARAIELRDVMDAFSEGMASPTLISKRDQLAQDLNRFFEVSYTLRNAYEGGGVTQPSNPLAAFVAHERLDKEYATVFIDRDRVRVSLGDKAIADADAANEHKRATLINKRDAAEMKWEQLRDNYTPEVLGRAPNEDELRAIKNAKARHDDYRRQVEKMPETPMASVISDETEHIVFLVDQYLEDISTKFREFKHARDIVRKQGQPVRRSRQLDATIPVQTAKIERSAAEIAEMRRLVEQALRTNKTTITYTPYIGATDFMMTPQEVLDEIANKTRDKITQQQEQRLRKKARDALAEGDEDRPITWKREFTGNTEPKTISVYDAENEIRDREGGLISLRWSLEENLAERAASVGHGPRWIEHFDSMINDQLRPPHVEILRGELRDIEHEIERRFPPWTTEAEQLDLQLRRDRLDMLKKEPLTEGELENLTRKRDIYAKWENSVRTTVGGEAAYLLSLQDDGRALFEDVVSGLRPITPDDVNKMTDLMGSAEEAEHAAATLDTFRELVGLALERQARETGVLTDPDFLNSGLELHEYMERMRGLDYARGHEILGQLRAVVGDSKLTAQFESALETSLLNTGWEQTAVELADKNLTPEVAEKMKSAEWGRWERQGSLHARLEADAPMIVGARGAERAPTLDLGQIRNELVASLIESTMQAKDQAMADTKRILQLLGFDNFIQSTRKIAGETLTGEQAVARGGIGSTERLSILGYSISKEVVYDKRRLTDFVTQMLHGADYDWSHALNRKARNLDARMQRINMMRRSLGASVDEAAERTADPERFLDLLAKWREPPVEEPELGAELLSRIGDFNESVLPQDMDEILSDRIKSLQLDFARAVRDGDDETILRLAPQIKELNEGEYPALQIAGAMPTGTEAEAAVAAALAMDTPPPNKSAANSQALRQAAQNDYDNAVAALAAAEEAMGGGGPLSVPNPNAPTQARTLDDFMVDDQFERAPGGRLTRAEILKRKREINEELNGPLRRAEDRTHEQQQRREMLLGDLTSLNDKQWRDEEPWQIEAADDINRLETKGTPLPWDISTGEEANRKTIADLQADVERAKANLDSTKSAADPAHLGPGDATAGELADVPPAGPTESVARRDELQRQLDEARAAGDENAARWAEQQMGWLDDPDEAVEPAAVSPVEAQGVPDSVTEPGALAPPPKGVPTRLDEQFNAIVEEFRGYLSKYNYVDAPDEIRQRMAALSASARKLIDDRNKLIAADKRSRLLKEVPELAAYIERASQVHQVTPPSISADVWQILRNGPPVRTFDSIIEKKLKPRVRIQGTSGVADVTVGEVFPGGNRAWGRRFSQAKRPLNELTEKSLREQIASSPGRVVLTARERLITRLSEIRAERAAAQAEYMDVVNANMRAMRGETELLEELPPTLGPDMPNLSPEELEATAKGSLEGIRPELQSAMADEFRARRNLEAAKAKRAGDVADIARQEAHDARTQQLAELDMNLADVRTKIDQVNTTIGLEPGAIDEMETVRKQVRNALSSVDKLGRVNTKRSEDLFELSKTLADRTPDMDPDEVKVIAALLDSAQDAQRKLDVGKAEEDALIAQLKAMGDDPAKAKIAGEVIGHVAIDGWSGIGQKLLRGPMATLSPAGVAAGLREDQSVVIAKDLRDRLERVRRVMETPEAWKLVDKYTAFFKTYATARPGFHVRNALSAVFMNLVDGVRIRDMYDGMATWRAFTKNPRQFWESADERTRNAITAVFASGAGGQFAERGLASSGPASSRAYRAIMNNRFTRLNQRAGTMVEGAARMGMALNSAHRGQDLAAAVDRITKYHFNYRELSSMDVKARRYIPFWTFMSRNLPLQLEQMWLRPQMYLRYQSLQRNFEEAPDPLTPDYWLSQGAFTMDENAAEADAPWYLAPDLPHLRVHEPFEAMANGDWGKALLSDLNPLGMAPVEAFAFNKKVYTGAPIEGEYIEPSNWMKPLLPLLSLLGGTEQGASGQTVVDDRYAHVARSLLPPLETLERLTTEAGTRAGRQDETLYRFLGAPVLQLTDPLRRQTARGRRFEQREQRQTQAQLARL